MFLNFDGTITGPAINQFQQVRQGFLEPLLIAIGLAESYRVGKGWEFPTGEGFMSLKNDYEPGNLGFDPLGLRPRDEQGFYDMQTKELNNGRLAMIAIAGMTVQELLTNETIFQQLRDRFGWNIGGNL
jgi:light-harvesting complex I chlorophyll a/b binding protein 1